MIIHLADDKNLTQGGEICSQETQQVFGSNRTEVGTLSESSVLKAQPAEPPAFPR